MTIHELANFTGCSIRALHYYDKIGLLKPYSKELNGYRKYNEDSLRQLQQIMYYKEMDLSLKEIKDIMNQPDFDRKEAIREQRELLIAKRSRLNRLIDQMEQILEGEDHLDFSVFEHNELEEVFRTRMAQMDEEYQQALIKEYGSLEDCIRSMMEHEDNIKKSAIEYYGSVKKYIESLKQAPIPKEGMGKLQVKLDTIVKEITSYREKEEVSVPEIQQLVAQWKSTFQEISQMEDITELFRQVYRGYQESTAIIEAMDNIYGNGATVYLGKAMEYYDTSL